MSHFVMIRHKVRDFDAWKTGFDGHAPKRAEAGLVDRQLLQSTDDRNDVVILLESADLGRARSFLESADLAATMQTFGVASKPDITFLTG